jgi:hypothetical protein
MKLFLFVFTLIFGLFSQAQSFPYELKIDSISIPQLGGLQSFSVGQANGKWLVVGGRLDGLHRRQPWAAFDSAGHNTQLVVIDPILKKRWAAPLTALSTSLQEQLSSTNMEFIQKGEYLYLMGGYGISKTAGDHITFPCLTAIHLPSVIDAVINKTDFSAHILQVKDELFAVTGGQLLIVNDAFYLTGGHRFDGKYNPMGNGTFTQTYLSRIRKFHFSIANNTLGYQHIGDVINEDYLHRRDFNVIPQILPNGKDGLISFSGVFQKVVNLPYLNAVVIDKDSFTVVPDFAQYYNHYHCATLSLYDKYEQTMHNLFFGGIAQYYDSSTYLVQDNDVPFVKTVARVAYDKNGKLAEYKMPVNMPAYLGAASEFIINPTLSMLPNEVIPLDKLIGDTVLLGYIYGGIQSPAANIFWINTGVESKASEMIYPVFLIKTDNDQGVLNDQSINGVQLQLYPDPIEDQLSLNFNLKNAGDVLVEVSNMDGTLALEKTLKKLAIGQHSKTIKFRKLNRGDVYFVYLTIGDVKVAQKMIVN